MFILDTNVISELFRPKPEPSVERWIETTHPRLLYVTSITKAESLLGVAKMPEGKRKQILGDILLAFFNERLRTPILGFDEKDAEHFAQLVSYKKSIGMQMGEFDAQIAAIARRHGFSVVTRDVTDFSHCGISIFNPWESP